jgi:hypothetical protein
MLPRVQYAILSTRIRGSPDPIAHDESAVNTLPRDDVRDC